jgi:hypothetical protein
MAAGPEGAHDSDIHIQWKIGPHTSTTSKNTWTERVNFVAVATLQRLLISTVLLCAEARRKFRGAQDGDDTISIVILVKALATPCLTLQSQHEKMKSAGIRRSLHDLGHVQLQFEQSTHAMFG